MLMLYNGGNKDFRNRPKRKDRSNFGREFAYMVLNCFLLYNLESIEYDEYNPVDFTLENLSFGLECKRLKKTRYVTKAWLIENVVDRFSEQEKLTGKTIRNRVLVVSCKKWDKSLDNWLINQGIWIIETGQIDNKLERFEASLVFMNAFENVVWAIANKRKVCLLEELN